MQRQARWTERLELRIDPDTLDRLARLADRNDRSVAAEVRAAVRVHLEEQEQQ